MPSWGYDLFGFETPAVYGHNLLKTPQNLVRRMFLPHSAEEQMELKNESKNKLKRVLVRPRDRGRMVPESLLNSGCSSSVHFWG